MLDERIEEAVRTLENPDIAAFRAEGGRALGFFCSYVPEELLTEGDPQGRRTGCPE